MKNQIQNQGVEKTSIGTPLKSRKKVGSSRISMGLFEVKELQIESKHDYE